MRNQIQNNDKNRSKVQNIKKKNKIETEINIEAITDGNDQETILNKKDRSQKDSAEGQVNKSEIDKVIKCIQSTSKTDLQSLLATLLQQISKQKCKTNTEKPFNKELKQLNTSKIPDNESDDATFETSSDDWNSSSLTCSSLRDKVINSEEKFYKKQKI